MDLTLNLRRASLWVALTMGKLTKFGRNPSVNDLG
jgi:hypothetical protein